MAAGGGYVWVGTRLRSRRACVSDVVPRAASGVGLAVCGGGFWLTFVCPVCVLACPFVVSRAASGAETHSGSGV
eukprot:7206906-Prymnesium_polylepis.1